MAPNTLQIYYLWFISKLFVNPFFAGAKFGGHYSSVMKWHIKHERWCLTTFPNTEKKLRCLYTWSNSVLSGWYIFSIKSRENGEITEQRPYFPLLRLCLFGYCAKRIQCQTMCCLTIGPSSTAKKGLVISCGFCSNFRRALLSFLYRSSPGNKHKSLVQSFNPRRWRQFTQFFPS